MKIYYVICWGPDCDATGPEVGHDWVWFTIASTPEAAGRMADEYVPDIFPKSPQKCANMIFELGDAPEGAEEIVIVGPLKGQAVCRFPSAPAWCRETRKEPWRPFEELYPPSNDSQD